MKILFAAVLMTCFSAAAFAGQLRFNSQEKPVCYVGDAKSALKELLDIDYDPTLSNGRVFKGSRDGKVLLYAEQYDENGWLLQKFVVPPCR